MCVPENCICTGWPGVCVGFKICERDRGHIVRGHTNARSIEA